MIIKIASELGLRLLAFAAPSLPAPVIRPDLSARNERRLQTKSSGPGLSKRG